MHTCRIEQVSFKHLSFSHLLRMQSLRRLTRASFVSGFSFLIFFTQTSLILFLTQNSARLEIEIAHLRAVHPAATHSPPITLSSRFHHF
jgi:hypothetical protein